MADDVVRLAVWSGPRNISTALMRAWENRPDTVVVDEPLYAHYLATKAGRGAHTLDLPLPREAPGAHLRQLPSSRSSTT